MFNKIRSSTKFKKINRHYKSFINDHFINNSKFLPEEIDRVYHIHIRKSGGTSVNNVFWKLCDHNMDTVKSESILIGNGRSAVRLDKVLINQGNYFYASSHFPIWQLNLRPNTYSFTVLREPLKRLLSLYKYYKWVEVTDEIEGLKYDPSFKILKSQDHLLHKNFKEFVKELSSKYLYGNLYMFSESLTVDEALVNLQKVNKVLFQHNLTRDFNVVADDLHLNLKIEKSLRKFNNQNFTINENEIDYAKDKLSAEYDFYNKALSVYGKI